MYLSLSFVSFEIKLNLCVWFFIATYVLCLSRDNSFERLSENSVNNVNKVESTVELSKRTNMGRRVFRQLYQNLGHGSVRNKLTQIEHLLELHKPHILYIAESRIDKKVKDILTNVHGYSVETLGNQSRIWAIINKSVKYERLTQFERNDMSAIWFKIGTSEKFISGGYYREWREWRS